ncbi:MAG: chemotaxis response regulator protein-glutamate methylesterase [Acidobacteriaceae bacterium]
MTVPHKIRILVADDSSVMRSLLRMVLDPHPELEIVAAAADGEEAVTAFDRLHPDLVLLDIDMPRMNGLEALSALRRRDFRVPIIMCSTLTWRGARVTLEALARGATDYVPKPTAQQNVREGVATLSSELLPRILALCAAQPVVSESVPPVPAASATHAAFSALAPRLVVIGVSTGGPAALEALLPQLPATFPLPILIVQHMPRLFTGLLADRLDSLCSVRVREAVAGIHPEPGIVHLARGDWHLELGRDFRLRLNQNAPEHFCRPSVDVLFRSAALACSGRLLAIVLTGMGSDGLAGCRAVRAAGGAVFVQNAATSLIWGMPGAVANAGLADRILPLSAIAGEMQHFARGVRPSQREAVAV